MSQVAGFRSPIQALAELVHSRAPPVSQSPHRSILIMTQFFCSLNLVRFIAYVGEQGYAEMGTYWREWNQRHRGPNCHWYYLGAVAGQHSPQPCHLGFTVTTFLENKHTAEPVCLVPFCSPTPGRHTVALPRSRLSWICNCPSVCGWSKAVWRTPPPSQALEK